MKSYILLIFLILGTRCFGLDFVSDKFYESGYDILGIFTIILLGIYYKRNIVKTGIFKLYFIFYSSVILSNVVCYIDWNQNFLSSLISQRSVYWGLLFIYLKKSNIQEYHIFKSLNLFMILYFIVWAIQISIYPNLISRIRLDEQDLNEKGILHFGIEGITIILFYLYILLAKASDKLTIKTIIHITICLLIIFTTATRSFIFPVTIAIFYCFFVKTNTKLLKPILVISGVIIFTFLVQDEYSTNLIKETKEQINNPEYARWISLDYFLTQHNKSWYAYILGNGFGSTNYSYGLMIDKLKTERGIYQSDIGLIGQWSVFGLFSIIPIYWVVFNSFKSKIKQLYLKLFSFHVLIMPTIFYLLSREQIIAFTLFIYLFFKNYSSNTINSNMEFTSQR